VEISTKFRQAAGQYEANQFAIQLRSMNLLYEGMKEKTTLMVVPSSMMESMGPAGFAGLAALAKEAKDPKVM
jgi:hypothetical protein